MTKNESPIEGTKGYTINLITHEIFNSDGKRMKPFVDSRGRVSIKLRVLKGGQQVFIIKSIASKLSVTEVKQKQVIPTSNELTTYTQFFANIDTIMSEATPIAKYLKAKQLITDPDLKIIQNLLVCLTRVATDT
mgnify:CR=1 FL=1|tara:strand:+ start:150 stop:551 length:402 start_codon:yes stop_codon:yes gene_type:complete